MKLKQLFAFILLVSVPSLTNAAKPSDNAANPSDQVMFRRDQAEKKAHEAALEELKSLYVLEEQKEGFDKKCFADMLLYLIASVQIGPVESEFDILHEAYPVTKGMSKSVTKKLGDLEGKCKFTQGSYKIMEIIEENLPKEKFNSPFRRAASKAEVLWNFRNYVREQIVKANKK